MLAPTTIAKHALLWLGLALALAGCAPQYHGAVFDTPRRPLDFTLTDQSGQPWRLADQRDRLLVIYFGYTTCADVCPRSLATLASTKRRLGADGARLQGVLISLDPERDTQEALQYYVRAFDPSFVGLRPTEAELRPLLQAFDVTSVRRELPGSALSYVIDHSSYFYAIDQNGCYRGFFKGATPVDDLASDLRRLLTEPAPTTCR